MSETSAEVIAYSQAPSGAELITFKICTHRYILAEINTHKNLSRNYQSSRAVPLRRQRRMVMNECAKPVAWGSNQRGMQAGDELTGWRLKVAKALWKSASLSAIAHHWGLEKIGLHKQWTNRVIEPYMYTVGIITVNVDILLDNIFALRLHKDAQPEFQHLCQKMREALNNSGPNDLSIGEWHIPYREEIEHYLIPHDLLTLSNTIKMSVAMIAQVSYRRKGMTLEQANRIVALLGIDNPNHAGPIHYSPAEHVAMASRMGTRSGNLVGFTQYRKLIEKGM